MSKGHLIQVQSGRKSFGSKIVLENVQFSIGENEHIGVIGPNGAGKSTLFKVMTGEIELDDGQVIRSQHLSLGYLAQEVKWDPELTAEEYLDNRSLPIWSCKSLARDFGFTEEDFKKTILSFSGGYQMRWKLLALLADEPNLLLLDEPTNYLDLETLLVLEKFLQGYKGSFLLISHDREFLRRTTDHTLEIENGEATKFPGQIDDYFEQKALLREQLQKHASSVEAKRKEILDFAAKFGAKASKARQAQSRMKQLKKMESVELKALPISARITIPPPHRIGKKAIEIKSATLGYPKKIVLSDVNMSLQANDHLAIVGFNGAGKSTLLKTLAGALPPIDGEIELGYEVSIGYYAQHVAESLDPKKSVFDELESATHSSLKRQDILDLAGSLLFSGDDVHKLIGVLSGGEKSRVALGKILLKRSPVLLLDEPTNHLDFNTVEALTEALKNYPGTVVIVSHDRSFVKRIANKILEVRQGALLFYPGTYDEYLWSLENGSLSKETPVIKEKKISHEKTKIQKKNHKEERKNLEKKIRVSQKNIDTLESEIEELKKTMETLSLKLNESQGNDLKTLSIKLKESEQKLHWIENQWWLEVESKENLEQQLSTLISNH
ncbi:MAG: ABC transporter ATP-binding protein [Bdellovibrionaceae bacterium]|nr:ABC transporter ATP-binding protein [Pseudobdellovibrionaceae bacterium]|tara:strand:- start:1034 stop:2863 length:1830 start_codon:yes stop_codon:yes gene_type:complete